MAVATAAAIQTARPATCTASAPGGDDTVYSFLRKRWVTMSVSTMPIAVKQGSNMNCYNSLMKELSSTSFLRAAHRLVEFVDAYGKDTGRCMAVLRPMYADVLTKASTGHKSWTRATATMTS
ncbi:hypothetical protein F5Y19DRAFT_491838 [Xylariaceae sp. FL1651]|nr:hypothetical protein F5Y19DRAFT_491838 [Xylariaceae sp. FL1651]